MSFISVSVCFNFVLTRASSICVCSCWNFVGETKGCFFLSFFAFSETACEADAAPEDGAIGGDTEDGAAGRGTVRGAVG